MLFCPFFYEAPYIFLKAGNVAGDFDIPAMANFGMWKVADPTTFHVLLWTVALDKQTTKSPSRLSICSLLGV